MNQIINQNSRVIYYNPQYQIDQFKYQTIMTVRCPYNQQHIMPVQSLLRHLSSCKATNKADFSICKYNQLHVVRKHQIQQHYKHDCPDKKQIKGNKHSDEDDWNTGSQDSKIQNFDQQNQDDLSLEYRQKQMSNRNVGDRRNQNNVLSKNTNTNSQQQYSKFSKKNWYAEDSSEQVPKKSKIQKQKKQKNTKSQDKQKDNKSSKNEFKKKKNLGNSQGLFDCNQSIIEKKHKQPIVQDF